MEPVGAAEFAALMAPLGPFEPWPHLAVAVSGGADSMALALLARDWARARGGRVTALVADHTLRPDSAAEAAATITRLDALAIPARLLTLAGLRRGPGLAERARTARYEALEQACAGAGILHLLLGHHAADQAETVLLRMLAGSGPAGLAAMAAVAETPGVRLLRPLLTVPPGRLRATLRAAGVAWVEDPSNRDPQATRARLRLARRDSDGAGPATAALVRAAAARGAARAAAEAEWGRELGARVTICPAGFAVLTPGPLSPGALGALLRTIAGAARLPSERLLARLAANPRPATLGGARLVDAGRLGPGFLVVREEAAIAAPAPAIAGALWDGRFRLPAGLPPGLTVGALGDAAAAFRTRDGLPTAVLRTLPAFRTGTALVAVPHIGYAGKSGAIMLMVKPPVFAPANPMAGSPFRPPG